MNKIKSMLKEASTRQIINDVDKNHIISNIDTNKVLNNQNKKKMPRRKLIPLFASCILIFGAILSISLYFGLKSNDKGVTRTYDDEFLNELEEFYEDTTVSESYNMINIVNTFDKISFTSNPITLKELTPEMELSIVNDTNTFINNIENMYNIKNITSTLINNKNKDDYEKTVEVISDGYKYNLYFNEKLVEEKNVDGLNYKYKSEVDGVIIKGDNQYIFNGIKRIKNSYLEYETTIIINDNYHIDVKEKFTMNTDLSLKYKQFEFYYDYYNNENKKSIEMIQKFNDEGLTKEIRFVANRSLENEFKMTINPFKDNLFPCKIDRSNSNYLYINIVEDGYIYKFKNSSNEYNL